MQLKLNYYKNIMNKLLSVKGYQFELIEDESGCLVHIKSALCKVPIVNFLNKNLPDNLNSIPKMKEYLTSMIDEYTKNDKVK